MEKRFKNSFGNVLIINDQYMSFCTRNVRLAYGDIESIRLNKGKVLIAQHGGGQMVTFVVDEADRDEMQELVAEIEQWVANQSNETNVKTSLSKYVGACIGVSLITLVLVGVMILLSWVNYIALAVVLLIAGLLMTTYFTNTRRRIVPQALQSIKTRDCVCQIVAMIICFSVSIGAFIYFTIGFREGEYLDKTCYWYDCSKPADGGVHLGGLYNPDTYYCKEHFEIEKNYVPSNKNENNGNGFTNKYGTPTTKCAHTGCSEYIASSGDTNCCVSHSRKCLNCGCYIDEDALYCMICIKNALD